MPERTATAFRATPSYSGGAAVNERNFIKPLFERHGNVMQFEFEQDGFVITLDQFHESRGELKATVRVHATAEGIPYGVVAWATVSLSSVRSRSELERECRSRQSHFPWGMAFLYCFEQADREWRAGEPIIDLASVKPPKTQPFLVRPILPKALTTVIFAAGGAGKTTLARALALHVRTGRRMPGGIEPCEQTDVLILDWEANQDEHARDLAALSIGMGLPNVPRIQYRQCFRPLYEEVDRLAAEVSRLRVGLVIIDSLAPATGDNPLDSGAATRTMNAIRQLGATALVIAHLTKADASNGLAAGTIFGSVFYHNLARSVWELKAAGDDTNQSTRNLALFHRKANTGPLVRRPIGLRLVYSDLSTTVEAAPIDLDSPLSGGLSVTERIRLALRRGPLTVTDLEDELAISANSIRPALNRMRDAVRVGDASRGGRGNVSTWALRAPGDSPPKADTQCRYCGNELEFYAPDGTPLCETHRDKASA